MLLNYDLINIQMLLNDPFPQWKVGPVLNMDMHIMFADGPKSLKALSLKTNLMSRLCERSSK